jgi:hypothetical protein
MHRHCICAPDDSHTSRCALEVSVKALHLHALCSIVRCNAIPPHSLLFPFLVRRSLFKRQQRSQIGCRSCTAHLIHFAMQDDGTVQAQLGYSYVTSVVRWLGCLFWLLWFRLWLPSPCLFHLLSFTSTHKATPATLFSGRAETPVPREDGKIQRGFQICRRDSRARHRVVLVSVHRQLSAPR